VLCCAALGFAGYTWDGVIHKMTDKQWGAMLDIHVSGMQKSVLGTPVVPVAALLQLNCALSPIFTVANAL
jgi:hypothetical protein